jgi:LysM repeat protein
MIRVILLVILVGLLAAMGIGGYLLYDHFILEPGREIRAEKEAAAAPAPECPSLEVWRELLTKLAADNPASAVDRIRLFLAEHPRSEVRPEAFDLLTIQGARWLFSNQPAPWKEVYRVVSGDSMNRISSRQGVASDWIMKVNNLMDYNLSIGQELLLPKPELRLIASRGEGRLFVLNGEELLLAYPLTFSDVPESAVGETTVREKIAASLGSRFAFGTPGYVEAEKTISLEGGVPNIRLLPEGLGEMEPSRLPAGLLLSRPDLEEVFLLVKRGTPVIIE